MKISARRIRRCTLLLLLTLAGAACGRSEAVDKAPTEQTEQADQTGRAAAREPKQAREPRKIALLVAVGEYAPESGWGSINSGNDVSLIRGALERQGFEPADIEVVTDSEAIKPGIESAFRQQLLARAGAGDVVVFHYSGHGHRITDDNHDEIDGYDEVLVPYDAPQNPEADYGGEKHLRDDELEIWINELRRKVGPDGDVLVSFDSCFSGSANRGVEGVARGSEIPIGLPQPAGTEQPAPSTDSGDAGFLDGLTRGSTATADGSLSPYTYLSASRHDELAFETRDEEGRPVGSLSYALSHALSRADERTTYRSLFEQVQSIMAGHVRNRPQAEGDLDRVILNGRAVAQSPFIPVSSLNWEAKTAILDGGTLLGLIVGSRVAIHPVGTTDPHDSEALVAGEVTTADPFRARMRLDLSATGSAEPRPDSGWAFVTEPAFGSLRIQVRVEAQRATWRQGVIDTLTETPFVQIAEENPDVVVLDRQGLVAETAIDGVHLVGPLMGAPSEIAATLTARLTDFARNRLLRRIDLTAPGLEARFDLVPCILECTTDEITGQELCDCGSDIETATPASGGKHLEMSVGEGFKIRLVNTGQRDVWVSILDLMPDGQVHLLWPLAEQGGEDNVLSGGAIFEVPISYRIGPPAGLEVLKLIASLQPVDFRPITTDGFRGQATRGPLDSLFEQAFDGTRAQPTLPRGSLSTWDVSISITENMD